MTPSSPGAAQNDALPREPRSGTAMLWWLPVGAGGHVAKHTSRWWEAARAVLARRPARPLFHSALEVYAPERTLIEMAPAWGVPAPDRGVVATGPVGMRALGRSRFFRYEVRRWRDGILPDRRWAVGGPIVLDLGPDRAAALLADVSRVPLLTWGRDEKHTGDMWNSNSLTSWLLARRGIPVSDLVPPGNGTAPGWAAGSALRDLER